MAVTDFAAGIEAGLNNIQGDFLAKNAALDDDAGEQENNQLLTLLYVVVKAIRARQRSSNARDRVLATYVGGHSERAFLPLFAMIEPVYQEFLAAADAEDTAGDDPWDTNYLTKGTGPQSGPVH